MTNVNVIALDMDGVVNSNYLIRKWSEKTRLTYKDEFKDEWFLENKVHQVFRETFDSGRKLIFQELADKVTRLCRETDSYILWSTSWRTVEPYRSSEQAILDLFKEFSMPYDRFIGCTPRFNAYRGVEISAWLQSNKKFSYEDLHRCAVLDDLSEAGQGLDAKSKLFQTNPELGITDNVVEAAKKFLLESADENFSNG